MKTIIYSEQDLDILHRYLSKYPSNYQEAFRQASNILNIDAKQLSSAFYMNKQMKAYFKEKPIQGLHSNNTLVEINRKNCPNIEGKKHPDLYQVYIESLGVVQQNESKVLIKMQTASFNIGGIIITGENIQITKI